MELSRHPNLWISHTVSAPGILVVFINSLLKQSAKVEAIVNIKVIIINVRDSIFFGDWR